VFRGQLFGRKGNNKVRSREPNFITTFSRFEGGMEVLISHSLSGNCMASKGFFSSLLKISDVIFYCRNGRGWK